VRFDRTNSCLCDSFINALISTQGSVSVALRQAVDKVIFQGSLRTKEIEHMKVLKLALCRQIRVATSKFSTRAGSRFAPKHYGSAMSLSDREALRKRQLATVDRAQLHNPKRQPSYE
jgi:hypothetical protein